MPKPITLEEILALKALLIQRLEDAAKPVLDRLANAESVDAFNIALGVILGWAFKLAQVELSGLTGKDLTPDQIIEMVRPLLNVDPDKW